MGSKIGLPETIKMNNKEIIERAKEFIRDGSLRGCLESNHYGLHDSEVIDRIVLWAQTGGHC